ncbi:MAG: hypothetical protein GVY27_10255 [Deinococcus-Thermus bacterium]|nr:hypothetical protein [Deinococcota bacterium]
MARLRTRPLTLRAALRLAGYDRTLPPGRYFVETDEGTPASKGAPVYRRILERIPPRQRSGDGGAVRSWTVTPGDMDAALERGDVVLDAPAT